MRCALLGYNDIALCPYDFAIVLLCLITLFIIVTLILFKASKKHKEFSRHGQNRKHKMS